MHDNSSDTPRRVRRLVNPAMLREVSRSRLPDMLQQKQQESEKQAEERLQRLHEKFLSETEAAGRADSESAPVRSPARSSGTKRGKVKRRKEYLEPKQHARLRDQIEHLWAVDKRFRNWSLLAKAAGLSSGQAVKRAYEVNSSMATLRNIDTFARLHAGFGSRATTALKAGVTISDLQAHLMRADSADAGDAAAAAVRIRPAAAGRPTPLTPKPELTMGELGDTPPTVDFTSMLEAGRAVETEVRRLWLVAKFFEQMSQQHELPRVVRESAAAARQHVLRAVEQFAAGGGPVQGDGPRSAEPALSPETS